MFAALSMIRCGDFLDVQQYVKDMQQYDSIFVRENTTKQWLWEVYSSLSSTPSLSNGALYFASDEAIYNDANASCELYQNGQYSSTNPVWEDRYNAMYVGIRTASIFIHNVHRCLEVSSAERERMEGEARFLRAYFYWIALDVFGDVPFTTETSPFGGGVNPKQASRKDVFDYCISELTDLASDESAMPAARSNYPRADKGAVNGLLARMYLNAEVYAGTPMWTEAKSACEAIFGMGYSLCPEYSDLFRGDNGENADALKEIIFGVAYDAEQTQSYGGTSYLTLAAIAATDVTAEQKINGVNNGWAGIRVPYEYVQKYFNARNADYTTGEYTVSDKRGGMFYIKGRQESMNDALYVFLNGWTCLKFNNIPHDMTNDEFLATAASKAYSDIDFPMIRLGEIYQINEEKGVISSDTLVSSSIRLTR